MLSYLFSTGSKTRMPKGFLVKRTKRHVTCSWRPRTDEERSDSGSEPEARPETPNYYAHAREAQLANSPDSGYGGTRATNASPNTIVSVSDNAGRFLSSSPAWSTSSSPPCVVASSRYDSPFHLATFGCLTMTSPFRPQTSIGVDAVTTSPSVSVTAPASPNSNKKRTSDVFQTTSIDRQKSANRKSPKKPKAARKINFEAVDNTSPVLGTIIRDAAAIEDGVDADGLHMRSGDIDPSLNVVDVSPEARAELERIENVIGDYVCRLCRGRYEDAFRLAQHRCSCIVHVEYRCPECDKAFNCPANLASHRRWHKPRVNNTSNNNNNSDIKNKNDYISESEQKTESEPEIKQLKYPIFTAGSDPGTLAQAHGSPTSGLNPGTPASPRQGDVAQYPCDQCAKTFRRHAYLRKHVASCHVTRFSSTFVGDVAARMDHAPAVCSCNVCGRTFADPTVRDAHVRLHAVSQSLGGARYPELLQLQRRLEAALADRQPTLSCQMCDDSFHSKQTLARHIDKCHVSSSRQLLNVPRPPPIVDRTC